jgi:predicted aspartyl protease
MKKLLFYLMLALLFTNCAKQLTKEQSAQLLKAYNEKNFFVLNSLMSKIEFSKRNPQLLLYKATLDNVFNNPEESNSLINKLLKKYEKYFNDTIIKDLYSMKVENSNRLQDYKSAYIYDSLILTKYKHICDSADIDSRTDEFLSYRILAHVSKMEITKHGDCQIPLKRDKAGLFNVPVVIKNDTVDFVFDTGANVSVITESLAKKYGIKTVGGKVKIGGSTGFKFDASIGLVDLKLGKIEIKNSYIMIFPDSTLSFANGIYKIRGVIGFPIMYNLQEFIVKDDKVLIVPQKPEVSNNKNLALDDSYPVIMVTYGNDTLPFHFDSGATNTEFYSRFLTKYKKEIVGKCKLEKTTSASAGGAVESETYIMDSVTISAGNSVCNIESVRILQNDLMGSDVKYQYGNFGQDYIKQFSEMKMNFASMNISFTGKRK